MKRATITEAKNSLSALIDLVRHGESVIITDRGRPVARLIPAPGAEGDEEGRVARLERAGIIRRGTGRMPTIPLLDHPPLSSGVLDALLDERREGR